MIERIAQRAGGFASTTAVKWLGSVRTSAPQLPIPPVKKRTTTQRLRKPLARAALAGTVALISSNDHVRNGVARGLRKIAETSAGSPSPRSSTSRSSSSTAATTNGSKSSNGSASLSKKTKTELYELAKKEDVPGRSNMSKQQLAKALSH